MKNILANYNFEELFDKLRSIDIDSLERLGKDYTFTDIQERIRREAEIIFEFSNYLQYLEPYTDNVINDLRSRISSFIAVLERIRDFDPIKQDPAPTMQAIKNDFNRQWMSLMDNFFPKFMLLRLEHQLS